MIIQQIDPETDKDLNLFNEWADLDYDIKALAKKKRVSTYTVNNQLSKALSKRKQMVHLCPVFS